MSETTYGEYFTALSEWIPDVSDWINTLGFSDDNDSKSTEHQTLVINLDVEKYEDIDYDEPIINTNENQEIRDWCIVDDYLEKKN